MPSSWRDDALAEKWAHDQARAPCGDGRAGDRAGAEAIGSSLEAAPELYIADDALRGLLATVDMAEICITSGLLLVRAMVRRRVPP